MRFKKLEQKNQLAIDPKKRLYDIDRAKGVAIFLVVLGHLYLNKTIPPQHPWYGIIKYIIYSFNMSFFMFLSGFIMFHSYKPLENISDYKSYIRKRFSRLMPSYILFGITILLIKIISKNYLYVDNKVHSFMGIIDIFIFPHASSVRFLWYIYVLFIFYAITPILLMFSSRKIWTIFCSSLLIYFVVPRVSIFSVSHISEYFATFLLGGFLASHLLVYHRWLNKWGWICFVIFLVLLNLVIPLNIQGYNLSEPKLLRLILGFLSGPAIHWLVRFKWIDKFNIFSTLGKYVFTIYLMNTIAIGGVKAIILRLTNLELTDFGNIGFSALSAVLLLSGICLPILIKKYALPKIPAIDNLLQL